MRHFTAQKIGNVCCLDIHPQKISFPDSQHYISGMSSVYLDSAICFHGTFVRMYTAAGSVRVPAP